MLKFKGAQQLRQRLVYATLASKAIQISDIRVSEQSPGLRDFEACLLRLLEKVTDGCTVEINETGTHSLEACTGIEARGTRHETQRSCARRHHPALPPGVHHRRQRPSARLRQGQGHRLLPGAPAAACTLRQQGVCLALC